MNLYHLASLSLYLLCYGIIDKGLVECACSPSCTSCVNDECERCLNGTYLDNSGDCLICPGMCTSCYDGDYCFKCATGYFGRKCSIPCTSKFCINNECDTDNGYCIFGCIDGYFQSGANCYPCESTCATCVNFSNTCTQCKEGYYGPSCQNDCSHCKAGLCSKERCTYGCGDKYYQGSETCNQCSNHCTSCSTFANCHACHSGFWGTKCELLCIECRLCNKDGSCHTDLSPESSTAATDERTTETTTYPSDIPGTLNTTEDETETSTGLPEGTDDDDMIPIYAAAGVGGLLVIIVVIVVILVCKRKGARKLSNNDPDVISMTENENYISADEINVNHTRADETEPGINNLVVEDKDNLYSLPKKTDHASNAIMETIATPDQSASEP